MFKKVIGLVLVLIIFFFAIKAITFLPSFTNAVIGNNQSPFQIGTNYIDQINQIYPYQTYGDYKSHTATYSAPAAKNPVIGKVTLEKISGKLVLSIENANPTKNLNIWLTNSPTITDKTEYVDFGLLQKNSSIQQYVIDMKGGDISFAEYNTVLIVDANNTIYATVSLK